jgi:hypothetical protein
VKQKSSHAWRVPEDWTRLPEGIALERTADGWPRGRIDPKTEHRWANQPEHFRRQWGYWRRGLLGSVPGGIARAIEQTLLPLDERDYREAHRCLLRHVDTLKAAHIGKAFDEQSLRDTGANAARCAARMDTLAKRESWARWFSIEPPDEKRYEPEGRFKRLECERWWRRKLRAHWTRAAEEACRELGFVSNKAAAYVSEQAFRARQVQRERGVEFLSKHVAVNELGEQLLLFDVAEGSVSNPVIRRGELMCRARGFETIAGQYRHAALFVTLTCPSAFHCRLASSGALNPAWDRATVRAAQGWLCRQWARARAKLKRLSILVYGFRVAEPHHDGTPHWHMLIWCPRQHEATVRTVLRSLWLAEFADEPGAAEHRIKFESIDSAKGSAVGYIAKYVSKNIDGGGEVGALESDEAVRLSGADSARRVEAWRSLHAIRQFQQLGGPPVGLWRECRRIREPVEDELMERSRAAADAGDWARFIRANGGIHDGRHTSCRLAREERGRRTRYGEAKAAEVVGLKCGSVTVLTRLHDWRIEKCGTVLPPEEPDRAGSGREEPDFETESNDAQEDFSESAPRVIRLGPVEITVRDRRKVLPDPDAEWAAVWRKFQVLRRVAMQCAP